MSTGSGLEVERILDLMRRATQDVGDADGVVLALAHPDLPRATGWFHSDVAPGFSATFPHIVYDALVQCRTSSSSRARSAPRTTWTHVKIGSGAGAVGELWLYRGQPTSAQVTTGSWVHTSPVMRGVLDHVGNWSNSDPDVERLKRLNQFARDLNALGDFDAICQRIAACFRAELRATGVLVELLDGDAALVTSASDGPTPIKDGIYTSRRAR